MNVDEKLMQDIVNYLVKRPWHEVNYLLQRTIDEAKKESGGSVEEEQYPDIHQPEDNAEGGECMDQPSSRSCEGSASNVLGEERRCDQRDEMVAEVVEEESIEEGEED